MEGKIRYAGIDLSKRTYQVAILDEKGKAEQFNGKTDGQGLERLSKRLNKDDLVGIEAGNNAFNVARFLLGRVECAVVAELTAYKADRTRYINRL